MRSPDSSGVFIPDPSVARLVVIGNFDGVHRGHQAVLHAAAQEAEKRDLELVVLTFDPHPSEVIGSQKRLVLTKTSRKVALLESTVPGLRAYVRNFTPELAALSPSEFAQQILSQELNAKAVLVGENFRFGNERAGDLPALQALGQQLGFEAWAETLRGDGGGTFSSTRVRGLLAEGRVADAAQVLGRPHFLSGTVARGDERGRTLGFPTANLTDVCEAVPQDGVYAVFVYELGTKPADFLGPGVANLGARPTVDRPDSLEIHLLDFDADLYGKQLGVTLVDHIRAVEKFPNIEALKSQIRKDVIEARVTTSAHFPGEPLAI